MYAEIKKAGFFYRFTIYKDSGELIYKSFPLYTSWGAAVDAADAWITKEGGDQN